MATVATRKFLCFLPVRFGVIVMALFGLLAGGILALAAWVEVAHMETLTMPSPVDKVALCIHATVYTLLAVISLFGIISTVLQRRTLVSLYSIATVAHLAVSIVSGIFYIVSLFRKHSADAVERCIASGGPNAQEDELTRQLCGKGTAIFNGVAVGFLCFLWIAHAYGCIMVTSYRTELIEKLKPGVRSVLIGRPQGPVMRNTYDSFIAVRNSYVANHPLPYAFTQPASSLQSSYGVRNANNV